RAREDRAREARSRTPGRSDAAAWLDRRRNPEPRLPRDRESLRVPLPLAAGARARRPGRHRRRRSSDARPWDATRAAAMRGGRGRVPPGRFRLTDARRRLPRNLRPAGPVTCRRVDQAMPTAIASRVARAMATRGASLLALGSDALSALTAGS